MPAIVLERLFAEIATSRAALLSTNKTTGDLLTTFFQSTKATINANNSAWKMIVCFTEAPRVLCAEDQGQGKKPATLVREDRKWHHRYRRANSNDVARNKHL